MKKYKIYVSETYVSTYKVFAESEDEAEAKHDDGKSTCIEENELDDTDTYIEEVVE